MEQRLSLVTLGVRDLPRSRGFYEAMGWHTRAAPDDEPLGACKHVAALAFAVADAIDRDPSLFLLWRGCRAVDPTPTDPWQAAALPEPRPLRALPNGAVLRRLGRSGIRVGGVDLADALGRAYDAFAATRPGGA